MILSHRQNNLVLSFSVPLVPMLPLVSIFFNVALMVHLNPMTWIRFIVWMVIGQYACVCVCVYKTFSCIHKSVFRCHILNNLYSFISHRSLSLLPIFFFKEATFSIPPPFSHMIYDFLSWASLIYSLLPSSSHTCSIGLLVISFPISLICLLHLHTYLLPSPCIE